MRTGIPQTAPADQTTNGTMVPWTPTTPAATATAIAAVITMGGIAAAGVVDVIAAAGVVDVIVGEAGADAGVGVVAVIKYFCTWWAKV